MENSKRTQMAVLMAMASSGFFTDPKQDEKVTNPKALAKEERAKRIKVLKARGLKKFDIGGREYWAINFKVALKKAKKDGFKYKGKF